MSLVEHGAGQKPDVEVGVPDFPITMMRGYDRQQVDVFVQDLSVRLTAERRRAEQAERALAQLRSEVVGLRNPEPPSFEHLGAEAGRVLEQAGNSAKLLVEEARNRGLSMVEEAREHAAALIERAEGRVADLEAEAAETLNQAAAERERILAAATQSVEEARRHADEEVRAALRQAQESAERTLHAAMSEQAAMQADTARLRDARDRMLDYLGRINSDLGSLLAEAVQGDAELTAAANGSLAHATGPEDDEPEAVEEPEDELETEAVGAHVRDQEE
jgi:cell division septum initiation protein DivIVA